MSVHRMDARGNKVEREKRGEAREWKSMRTQGIAERALHLFPGRGSVFKTAIKKL